MKRDTLVSNLLRANSKKVCGDTTPMGTPRYFVYAGLSMSAKPPTISDRPSSGGGGFGYSSWDFLRFNLAPKACSKDLMMSRMTTIGVDWAEWISMSSA